MTFDKQLIMFSSKSCGPCRMAKPVIEKYINNNPDINFEHYNVSEFEDEALLNKYEITSVPTFILSKNGNTFEKLCGWNSQTMNSIETFFSS